METVPRANRPNHWKGITHDLPHKEWRGFSSTYHLIRGVCIADWQVDDSAPVLDLQFHSVPSCWHSLFYFLSIHLFIHGLEPIIFWCQTLVWPLTLQLDSVASLWNSGYSSSISSSLLALAKFVSLPIQTPFWLTSETVLCHGLFNLCSFCKPHKLKKYRLLYCVTYDMRDKIWEVKLVISIGVKESVSAWAR